MMFGDSKTQFIEQTRAARIERANDRKREQSIILVQSLVRGWLVRKRTRYLILQQFDETFENINDLKPAITVYLSVKKFLTYWDEKRDRQRFEKLCSLECDTIKRSYISVALTSEHAVNWINHVKEILSICLSYLTKLQPKSLDDSSFLHTLLHMIVSFTSTSRWCAIHSNSSLQGLKPGLERLTENLIAHLLNKNVFNTMQTLLITGLLGIKILLKPVAMTAIMTICWRCLVLSNFSTNIFQLFVIKIYSIPLLVEQLISLSSKIIETFNSVNLLEKIMQLLNDQNQCDEIFHCLHPSWCLSLIANIVHLAELSAETVSNISVLDSERSEECIDFTMIFQKNREKQKKNDGKTGIFTQNKFSTKSIFLYGCNPKTNHFKFLKFSPNIYVSVIYIHYL
ncbi:ubiquitin-protein ligase E3B, partial [Aphis craccivora]